MVHWTGSGRVLIKTQACGPKTGAKAIAKAVCSSMATAHSWTKCQKNPPKMRFKKIMKLTDHTHACKNIAQKICRNLEKLVKSLIFGRFLAFIEPLCHSGQRPGQAACTDFRQRPVVVAEGPSSFQRPRSQSSLHTAFAKGQSAHFWGQIPDFLDQNFRHFFSKITKVKTL
jgi:hypothetical protein